MSTTPAPTGRMPRQIPYIIGNEGAERFSFYGMRNILSPFLVTSLLLYLPEEMRKGAAKDVFHTFVIGVYFFPLLGGYIADRLWGKYKTVLYLSVVYCAGHACLAIFESNRYGFYTGLFLIALGAGGIKPLVASFMGDQFDQSNKHLAKFVFDGFYWIINFGSFFASLLMPIFLREFGASVAFGIPGALMLIATIIFWAGRDQYVMIPPQPPNPHSFMRVVRTAIGAEPSGKIMAAMGLVLAIASLACLPLVGISATNIVAALCLGLVFVIAFGGIAAWMHLERARGAHPDDAVDGVRAVLKLLVIFALVTPFHSLFDQKASTWVLQADDMTKPSWFSPAQMQALNPALVMMLIPLNNGVLFPFLRRRGWDPSPLRRMTAGIALGGVAWVIVGVMQLVIDAKTPLPITWQILPYVFLTAGEVLVLATGLEFAYSQAPAAMKAVIMSFWNLTTTIGNLWVLLSNLFVRDRTVITTVEKSGIGILAAQMFFFAAFAFAAAFVFWLYSRRYRVLDLYRKAGSTH